MHTAVTGESSVPLLALPGDGDAVFGPHVEDGDGDSDDIALAQGEHRVPKKP